MTQLTEAQIKAEIDSITESARKRMSECSPGFVSLLGGSELSFMTQEELTRRHQLMLMYPLQSTLVQEARERIKARIAARHALRSARSSTAMIQA